MQFSSDFFGSKHHSPKRNLLEYSVTDLQPIPVTGFPSLQPETLKYRLRISFTFLELWFRYPPVVLYRIFSTKSIIIISKL